MTMTEHYVVVYPDDQYLERLAEIREVTDEDRKYAFAWGIECSDPEACPGWQECPEDHTGFEPEDIDEYEDVMIHGVLHTEYVYGWGWAVEYPGCPLQGAATEIPDGVPTDRPGRYLVEPEWWDTECYLDLIEEVKE